MNGKTSLIGMNVDYVIARITNGLEKVFRPSKVTLLVIAYILIAIIHIKKVKELARLNGGFPTPESLAMSWMIFFAAGMIFFIYLIGAPLQSVIINYRLEKIGMKNKHNESPMLLDIRTNKSGYKEMVFFSQGIPLSCWENARPELGAALNMEIGKILPISGKWLICVCAVSAADGIPSRIYWQESNLIRKDFVLNLGQSVMGTVTVNLQKIPHILLGGSTGSGKSVLLKCLIYQCWFKEAEILIADFKGGVDYGRFFKKNCTFVTEIDDLIEKLDDTVRELQRRKQLLAEEALPNIDAFNSMNGAEQLRRIVIAFDEVAEVLDKTGLSKAQKDKVAAVEEKLATIARLGRAFGIHLILSTQRPDATILSGQIRNNIDARYCGRADDVLSKIILDNTLASEEIPKYEQGLFMAHDGTVFRGYLFEEKWYG